MRRLSLFVNRGEEANGSSTLFELPSHVEHLLVVWLGHDALSRVKVERAFMTTVSEKMIIGKTSNCLFLAMIESELFNNNQLR